jgi:hypothetical protein
MEKSLELLRLTSRRYSLFVIVILPFLSFFFLVFCFGFGFACCCNVRCVQEAFDYYHLECAMCLSNMHIQAHNCNRKSKSKSGVGVVRCVGCVMYLYAALATRNMVHVEYGCQFQFHEIEIATFPVVRLLFVFVLHDGGGFGLVLHNDY